MKIGYNFWPPHLRGPTFPEIPQPAPSPVRKVAESLRNAVGFFQASYRRPGGNKKMAVCFASCRKRRPGISRIATVFRALLQGEESGLTVQKSHVPRKVQKEYSQTFSWKSSSPKDKKVASWSSWIALAASILKLRSKYSVLLRFREGSCPTQVQPFARFSSIEREGWNSGSKRDTLHHKCLEFQFNVEFW